MELLLLLLLLWSRKELNLANGNQTWCTDDEEDIATSQKPWAIAHSHLLFTIQKHPK
jgi:hypothetical protein